MEPMLLDDSALFQNGRFIQEWDPCFFIFNVNRGVFMELQIKSTINIIASADNDTTILVYALRYLIESCTDSGFSRVCLFIELEEKDIQNLPIVQTIITTYRRCIHDETVRMLCCSALIKYSRFGPSLALSFDGVDSCVVEADHFGLIRSLLENVVAETEESLLTMELAVIAAYSVSRSAIHRV